MTADTAPTTLAERMNDACFCITLERERLYASLQREAGDPDFAEKHIRPREHLFSNVPVFLSNSDLVRMSAVIAMVEAASRLRAYQEAVLAWAPEIARYEPGPIGAFMGYDFHVGPAGPRLIEVNTNAGGAFLNALLAQAQHACCPEVEASFKLPLMSDFDAEVNRMFRSEWSLQRKSGSPRSIAIVDDAPESQYLYPEFLIARRHFIKHGIDAMVCDAGALSYEEGKLRSGTTVIDMVYNRLVDFSLERPEHAALRAAYLAGAVVVTPGPRNHALLADKRNLTLLCDRQMLVALGLPDSVATEAAGIPRTVQVSRGNATELWGARKGLFFKPASGYGSKAVYRGDKITRGVWEEVIDGHYVAQDLAVPGHRAIEIEHNREIRKSDIRLFTYGGKVLLAAARLYQGQTTNFRTPGGGFAPVYFL